jgi:hypothetical protein
MPFKAMTDNITTLFILFFLFFLSLLRCVQTSPELLRKYCWVEPRDGDTPLIKFETIRIVEFSFHSFQMMSVVLVFCFVANNKYDYK